MNGPGRGRGISLDTNRPWVRVRTREGRATIPDRKRKKRGTARAAVHYPTGTPTAAVIKELKKSNFNTVLGKIGFDRKGDPTGETCVMYEWTKGNLEYFKK